MDFIRKENIQALQQCLADANRPVVLTHTHPDGDALGASSALVLYLRSLGKDAALILPDSPAENLRFILPESIPCYCNDQDAPAAESRIREADLIILADANHFSRTEGLQKAASASPARKVLMDHHLNPDLETFGLAFTTPDISSASEVVYWVLKSISEGIVPSTVASRPLPSASPTGPSLLSGRGWPEVAGTTPSSIDHTTNHTPEADTPEGASAIFSATEGAWPPQGISIEIGTALMIGMTTDTNNFANSVYPSTFRMASELIAAGVDRDALLQQIYNSYRENRVRLMGYMQSEQLHILPGGSAYMILTRDIQQRFGMLDGESEGLVNVPLTIGQVKLSVLLKEDDGHFRVSVRSKKGTSAQQLALRYFHGGGHENAAGGKLFIGTDIGSSGDAPAYVEQALKCFLP